jgi:NADPH-dependent F420 reductase
MLAIIGTGNVGGALGVRFAQSGQKVVFGARGDAKELVARAGPNARAATPAQAAEAGDVVFLAVPGNVAVEVAGALPLAGKIVVDCNNPLRWDAGPVWTPPAAGSLAAAIAKAAPGARVIKAFNGFGAEFHSNPQLGGRGVDVFMAGDDADAKKTLADVARTAGFTPVDAGPLRNAAVLENLAMLWIHLATAAGHGRNFAFEMISR